MRSRCLASFSRRGALVVAACLLAVLPARPALALGEPIRDIKILNNTLTLDETIRSIAGLDIGDTLEADALEKARERLHTAGLFSEVDAYSETYRDGVRVVITVRDKIPWGGVPAFSLASGNWTLGMFVGHSNLFGRGKRGSISARLSNVDSGGNLFYEDPAFWGSWVFWNVRGRFQDQGLPEYGNAPDLPARPIRETKVRGYGGDLMLGVAWFRKVKTAIGWSLERFSVRQFKVDGEHEGLMLPQPADDMQRGLATANVTFDFRAREHAIMYGNALSFNADWGHPRWGSDDKVDYWKATAGFEQGIRFFRRHNLVIRATGALGQDMPLWSENNAGAASLRGFLYRQFMGDTMLRTQTEYHFPMFSVMKLDFRGLVFHDAAAIWYRQLPASDGMTYEDRPDGRRFLPPQFLLPGFDAQRDIHQSVGAGLRFYLRTVAAPLLGIDVGHGIGTGTVRFLIVVGA
jgi:outer membrane protein assembly factor BamA